MGPFLGNFLSFGLEDEGNGRSEWLFSWVLWLMVSFLSLLLFHFGAFIVVVLLIKIRDTVHMYMDFISCVRYQVGLAI